MHDRLQKSITRVLAPLVRLMLRHGVSHAEFAAWAKQAYVEQAASNFGIDGRKPTVSRMAIVTGINRKEVKRILDLPADAAPAISKHNRAVRVVTGWLQDQDFLMEDGSPATLAYGDADDPFNQLVRRYGGDVPARAMLDELLRVGTVAKDGDDISLVSQGYVPHESEEAMLDVFATSATDLLGTLDHNLSGEGKRRLQMSVAYDNVSAESLQAFRRLSSGKALQLLRELDASLSEHDRGDAMPDAGSGRYRTGLGVYIIEDEIAAPDEQESSS